MRLNVGVIFGGKSVEHEISIISAIDIMSSMDKNKYNIIPIYIDKENNWYTGAHLKSILNFRDIALVKRYAKKVSLIKKDKSFILESHGLLKRNLHVIDIVLPIGHGAYLEDGSLQGYLNMLGVPFAGPSVLAAAIGQDKIMQKKLLEQEGLPVAKYVWFYSNEYEKNKKEIINKLKDFKYPLFVKPATLGSSIGITKVNDEKELTKAVKEASKLDKKILIEESIKNLKEVNIAVLGNHEKQTVSEIEEINSHDDFYSFKEKYVEGHNKLIKEKEEKVKPIISKEMIEDMKKYAIQTFKTLNTSGVARIDFLIDDKDKKIFINEINTIPGDLSSYLWMAKKMTQNELVDNLIKIAIQEKKQKEELTEAFEGNLLERYDILKGKKLNKKEENKKDKEK